VWFSLIDNFLHLTVGTYVIIIYKSSKGLVIVRSINAADRNHTEVGGGDRLLDI